MNGNLPTGYRTWLQLYKDLEKEGVAHQREVSVQDPIRRPDQRPVYRVFEVQYVKNQAFEEILNGHSEFTTKELQMFERMMFERSDFMMIGGKDLVDKIRGMIQARWKLGLYE